MMTMRASSRLAAGLTALLAATLAAAAPTLRDLPGGPAINQIDLPPPMTPIAIDQQWLHNFMLIVCTVIFIAVFGVMFYSIIKHRKSKGARAANFHESTTVEIAWTIVPFIIVILMALPATRVVVAMKDTSAADLTIKATGIQWKWGYDYVKGEGEGIGFVSTLATPRDQIEGRAPKGEHYLLEVDNPLVVPVGKKIRVLTTAADVIHSWWVPAFGAKQDAIPGFIRDLWFRPEKPGVYRSQCVELCGKEHGFMPIVVEVKTQEEYSKWVGEKKKAMLAAVEDTNRKWSEEELVKRGEQSFNTHCAVCHQQNGQGLPNTFPPLVGSNVVGGPKAGQIRLVLNGRKGVYRPNTAMPPQDALSDVDIAAAITYTRHQFTKSKENVVQPSEVKAARGK
jgi:cytochrome c oxidase subunit 2